MTSRRKRTPSLPDPSLAFTPVVLDKPRADGWTADRQRGFIAALARLGSVRAACASVGMASVGAYALRRRKNAEEFARAWARAQAAGVKALRDIAYERAVDGTPRGIWYQGERVGEERRYNDRLLMFMLRHEQPATYGEPRRLRPGTKHPATVAREARWASEDAEDAVFEEVEDSAKAADEAKLVAVERVLDLYRLKIATERRDRVAGNVVGADFALRQATILEVLLSAGSGARALVAEMAPEYVGSFDPSTYMTPAATLFAAAREQAWEEEGAPLRPVLREALGSSRGFSCAGPEADWQVRWSAQKEANRIVAHGQAMWEAAATPEGWAAWHGGAGHQPIPLP